MLGAREMRAMWFELAHKLMVLAGVSALIALCACFQRARALRSGGWNHLTPGPYLYVGLGLGIAVTALSGWIALVHEQTGWLVLAGVFGAMTIVLAFSMIVYRVRWNERWVECSCWPARTRRLAWAELARYGQLPSGDVWVAARAGKRLWFSPYCNGFDQLLDKMIEHLPDEDLPPDAAVAPLVEARVTLRR